MLGPEFNPYKIFETMSQAPSVNVPSTPIKPMIQPPIQALNDFSPIALKRKQYSFCDVLDSEDLEVFKVKI